MKQRRVRPLAICVFRKADLILVAEGYDPTKRETFYRPLGGEIDFGEYGHQTAVREVREEIDAEATDPQYLGTIENIFLALATSLLLIGAKRNLASITRHVSAFGQNTQDS